MKEKKNFKRLVIFAIAITMCISALSFLPTASAAVINVPFDYASIQDAIDAAGSGDTIIVAAGTYQENLASWKDMEITKSLKLIGAGSGSTIVELSQGKMNGVEIRGTNLDVTIEGITFTRRPGNTYASNFNLRIAETASTFTNLVLRDVEVAYANAPNVNLGTNGVYNQVIIEDCNFHHGGSWGLFSQGVFSNLYVFNSNFDYNGVVDPGHGIGFDLSSGAGSSNVVVRGGTFNNNAAKGINLLKTTSSSFYDVEANYNGQAGVALWEWKDSSSDLVFRDSDFSNNGQDGFLFGTEGSTTIDNVEIIQCDILANSRMGVFFYHDFGGSVSNINIHDNNIVGNGGGIAVSGLTTDIDAECNYYGDINGPTHPSNPCSGAGDTVTDYVDYYPFLDDIYPDGICIGCDFPDQKMHYPQLPDPNGWDVNACWFTLADDWQCSETGLVKDIHFWGSWFNNLPGTIESFHLSIHSDIPAGEGGLDYSRPGELLWELDVPFADVIETPMEPSMQGWLKPPNVVWEDNHEDWSQYDILLNEEDWFIQYEGTIYWLDINAIVVEGNRYWGWKSSEDHFNDDAVWWNEQYGKWVELYEPENDYPPITNWFAAEFNEFGELVEGNGDGFYDDPSNPFYFDGFYEYENTGWWNMWWYDHVFDPDRYKDILIEMWVWPLYGAIGTPFIEIASDWSTDLYYYDYPGSNYFPPIPPLTIEEENDWIGRDILFAGEPDDPVQHFTFTTTITDYNPEWVSIDLMGNEVLIEGSITHTCLDYPQSLDLAFVITGEPDDIPPTTIKEIGDPQCDNGQYVTTSTLITLTATDNPGGSGVKEIHYIINGVETVASGDTVTFTFAEECEHILEFWAVDNIGNIEEHTIQTHYVDDTPPTTIKTIGIPQYLGGQYVTTSTPITLTATDGGPICHSGVTELHYIINGFETIVYGDTVTFSFEEECTHVLEFWAVDCLGNEEQHTTQTHYVDDTAPTLTKTHPDHGYYQGYMKCGAEIILEAVDEGLCISGLEGIYYRILFNGVWSNWYTYSGPISFDEECVHGLEYYAIDNLGNIVEEYQEYYVDCTPPTITKTNPPSYVLIDPDPIMTGSIMAGSIITLDAIDGGTSPCIAGVENIFWRYEYDSDNYPESGDPGSIDGTTLGTLYGYTDPEIIDYVWYYEPDTVDISFTDLGKHDLFYWAKDNVCNRGDVHHQIYWVNECQDEVWVDDNYHSATNGWMIDHFQDIQSALECLDVDGIAHIHDGVYRGTIIVNDEPCDNTGITIEGVNHPVGGTAIIDGHIEILVDGVTVKNLSFMPSGTPVITVDAYEVTITQNVFLKNCLANAVGIHSDNEVVAEYNWWGASDGPEGGQMDDGATADGMGVKITGTGPVHVEPFVGTHAEATASSYAVDTGEPVVFDATGSFAAFFDGTYSPSYYWTFEPLYHSNEKQPAYVFSSPGNYIVSLRVQGNGINGLHDNLMFDWAYLSIEVNNPTSTLSANGGGSGLGIYETYVDEPLTLQGSASGGSLPYSYSWNLGDGSSSNEQNPTHTYTTADVYTVSLTVTDSTGDTAVDTVIVEVYEIGELFVNIGGPYNGVTNSPVYFNSQIAGGLGPYNYAWTFGDGSTSTNENPTHIYESEGTYTVTLTVTDSRDNVDTATTTIIVETAEEVAEIVEVNGGFGIKATIKAGVTAVDWTISVDGFVLMGHDANGFITAGTEEIVKIPFTIALGKVDITVTAGSQQETYTAFALGPLFLNMQEA